MTPAGEYSRERLRKAYADAWRKRKAREPLTPLEALITDVIALHPEYQPLVERAEAALDFESVAASGAENPFLHMGLHIAVREQVAIDRPMGIRELRRLLEARQTEEQ